MNEDDVHTGMRRPSWNKSQAIQQVISLKTLLEPPTSDSDSAAGTCKKRYIPRPRFDNLNNNNNNKNDNPSLNSVRFNNSSPLCIVLLVSATMILLLLLLFVLLFLSIISLAPSYLFCLYFFTVLVNKVPAIVALINCFLDLFNDLSKPNVGNQGNQRRCWSFWVGGRSSAVWGWEGCRKAWCFWPSPCGGQWLDSPKVISLSHL